jgi:hypothetical protein
MKISNTGKYRRKFKVVIESRDAESAMVTSAPGGRSDEEITNIHVASNVCKSFAELVQVRLDSPTGGAAMYS